jgi:hypothetical protein
MVHFLDSNSHLPASQTPGYNILTQCDTLELQLNQVESLCRQFNLPIQYSDSSEQALDHFKRKLQERFDTEHKSPHTLFTEIQENID